MTEPTGLKHTPEGDHGYWSEQVAETNKEAAITVAGIGAAGNLAEKGLELIKTLIQAGMSNPVAGAVGAVLMANILSRTKVISGNCEALIDGIVLTMLGVSVADAVIGDVTNIIDSINPFDLFKGGSPPTNDLAPTGQTFVFIEGGKNPDAITQALASLKALPPAH